MTQFATLRRRRQRLRQKGINFFVILCALCVPIFPASGIYAQRFTGVVVRGDIDESTILDTRTTEDYMKDLMQTDDLDSLSPQGPATAETLPAETAPVTPPPALPTEDPKKILYKHHIVTPRQTLPEISKKYSVSIDDLKKANPGLTDDLKIDQKILIPKIQGVEYTVKRGDTLGAIAQKYGIESLYTILLANDISDAAKIKIGQKILLPNPTKQLATNTSQTSSAAPAKKQSSNSAAPQKITYGSYTLNLKVQKGCRNFAWGNCTCFVAKYKNVTWRGNAKHWLANAKKAGAPTGNSPKPGAIIVYDGPGFPPAYGHVGIVMEVNEDHMIVKDMNYSGLNKITTRKEKLNNSAIKGYIYVD